MSKPVTIQIKTTKKSKKLKMKFDPDRHTIRDVKQAYCDEEAPSMKPEKMVLYKLKKELANDSATLRYYNITRVAVLSMTVRLIGGSQNDSAVTMSCGCLYSPLAIENIMRDVLQQSKVKYTFHCKMCKQEWDLDECAEAINLSDEKHLKIAAEIANRAAPTTKQCPFCHVDIAPPHQSGIIKVQCPECYNNGHWCWLCLKPWLLNRSKINCGNTGCKSNNNSYRTNHNVSKSKTTSEYNVDIEMSDKSINHDEDEKEHVNNNQYSKQKKRERKKSKKIISERREMRNGIVGLRNLGNTCFMNAALQTMLQTPGFIEPFFYDQVKAPSRRSLTARWISLIKEIYTTRSSYIVPNDIKSALNKLRSCIGNGEQQDSFYVIKSLLEALDDELCSLESEVSYEYAKQTPLKEQRIESIIKHKIWKPHTTTTARNDNSIVRQIFDGIECEILSCCKCNYQCKTFKTFREIELPLFNKLINLSIKVYVPQIDPFKAFDIELQLTFDNSFDGLKYLILSKIPSVISQKSTKFTKLITDDATVKIGYIHSQNVSVSTNFNEWFTYVTDTDDCSKIPNHSQIVALVHYNHDSQYYGDNDDEKEEPQMSYIPRFNLICDEDDQWLNEIPSIMFQSFYQSNSQILAKDLMEREKKDNYTLTLFYNNRVIHPLDTLSLAEDGCLLFIWVHQNYRKESPSLDTSIRIKETDAVIIRRALANSKPTSPYSLTNLPGIVQAHYSNFVSSLTNNLSSFLPACISNIDEKAAKEVEAEARQAEDTRNKLEKLSTIQQTASNWLSLRLKQILKRYQNKKINYTSPKTLNNVLDCLQSYESNEISDQNVMECLQCDECPDIVSKQVKVLQSPHILILHIDRYGDESENNFHKRDHLISYPTQNLQFKNKMYDLFGVVVHHGSNFGGHYICYVKSLLNNQWNEMNDTYTSPIYNINKVVSNNATVLLYHQKTTN